MDSIRKKNFSRTNSLSDKKEIKESLGGNIQDLLDSILNKIISHHKVDPSRLQKNERIEIIRDLEDAGFFLLKGGITAVATRLNVSEPTIYRYLVKVREG